MEKIAARTWPRRATLASGVLISLLVAGCAVEREGEGEGQELGPLAPPAVSSPTPTPSPTPSPAPSPAPSPTTPPAPSPTPPTGALTDRANQTFTGGGLSSQYHIYAAGLSTAKPIGLLVQLHGDGAGEFARPTSGKLLAMSALAQQHNLLMVSAKSPDRSGTVTWWESGAANAKWLQALLDSVYADYGIDKSRVWFSGYSGGAEFLTYYYVDGYFSTFAGGGALISGGGGANNSLPGTVPAPAAFKSSFRMHFYSGTADTAANAADGFCGYCAAQRGAAHFKAQGFTKVTTEYPAGVDHYSLDEPEALRKLLAAAYPDV